MNIRHHTLCPQIFHANDLIIRIFGGLLKKETHAILTPMNWIWVKKNQNILITVVILFLIIVCGIPLWLYTNEQQNKAASESYWQAIQLIKKDDLSTFKAARDSLEKVLLEHKGSKVAYLAKLEIAQLSFKLKETDKAIQTYESLLSKLSLESPLRPLILIGLKSSYHAKGNTEKVKNLKTELEKLGFSEK